mgnify:CR=1 FL=1
MATGYQKEATIVCLDVSKSMNEKAFGRETTKFTEAKTALSLFIQQKVYFDLILFLFDLIRIFQYDNY